MSELEHYDREIYAIEERLGRLAIACGIDLSNSTHVDAVREGNFAFCPNGDETSHRMLRELVLLRDYVTVQCASERGLAECREIIEDVYSRLRQHGFLDGTENDDMDKSTTQPKDM